MLLVALSFITAALISYITIPSIINVALTNPHLLDQPNNRKHHGSATPTLGGLAIFAAFIISSSYWVDSSQMPELQYIICALMLVFFMGIKDDLLNLKAYKKFIIQFLIAWILVHQGEIRLTSLYGIFNIHDIPLWSSYALSVVAIVGITNSFNLIDGIDLLAGVIGIIVMVTLGGFFLVIKHFEWSVFAFSMAGALLGFCYYNKTPAKIFMGDTGSLTVGIISSVLAIKFVELNRTDHFIISAPTLAISIMAIPLFDTIRVFSVRILQGRSPFSADKNHIHHVLLRHGLTHIKASLFLGAVNIVIILFAFFFQDIGKYFGNEEMSAEILLGIIFLFLGLSFLLLVKKIPPEKKNF